MKKILSIIIVIAMTLSLGSTYVFAAESHSTQMDNIDIIITAYSYAGGVSDEVHAANAKITVNNIVPLFNMDDEIIAYYVTFSSNEYAVVNNNTNNPTVIEFGEGKQKYIEDVLTASKNPKVVYNNPVSVYDVYYLNSLPESEKATIKSIDTYYPELQITNAALSAQLKRTKTEVLASNAITFTKGDGDYGFFSASEMPDGQYTDDTIQNVGSVDWAKMSDYNTIASNHCGATAVTNLALYFAENGFTNLVIDNSKDETFKAVHNIVGNGPVMMIAGHAENYFSKRGYDLNHSSVGNTSDIVTATTNERPCGILLIDGLFAWHWVIGVGWRQYTGSGDFYIQINNNWNGSANTYYKPGTGSAWWSATSYWVAE